MSLTTRRRFLYQTAAAGSLLALSPWQQALAAEEADQTAPALAKEPQMSIARWAGAEVDESGVARLATKLTENAIAALGGMQRFVNKGDVVWVKPNIGWNKEPQYAADTNPDVVATLVRLCLAAGAKTVKVGDHPCNDARQSYQNSGIAPAAEKAGAQIVYLDDNRYREVELNGKRLKKWPVYPEIIESDLVINVPIVKHHGLSRATLCMKNYMGVIGGSRGAWHQDIGTCLADITAFMKPRLCVLDAVRILTASGPVGGNLQDVKRMDTVAAGTDIVALDAFGAELLGHKDKTLDTVQAGYERGLGEKDFRKLALKEVAVS